jgi:hypothetical protein
LLSVCSKSSSGRNWCLWSQCCGMIWEIVPG